MISHKSMRAKLSPVKSHAVRELPVTDFTPEKKQIGTIRVRTLFTPRGDKAPETRMHAQSAHCLSMVKLYRRGQ